MDFFHPRNLDFFKISYQENTEIKLCVQEAHSKEEG